MCTAAFCFNPCLLSRLSRRSCCISSQTCPFNLLQMAAARNHPLSSLARLELPDNSSGSFDISTFVTRQSEHGGKKKKRALTELPSNSNSSSNLELTKANSA